MGLPKRKSSTSDSESRPSPYRIPFDFIPVPRAFFSRFSRCVSYTAFRCAGLMLEKTVGNPRETGAAPPEYGVVSLEDFAKDLNVTVAGITKAMRELEAIPGFLEKKRHGHTFGYRLSKFSEYDKLEPKPARKLEKKEKDLAAEDATGVACSVPVALTCPLGEVCPVDQLVEIDGMLTNDPQHATGVACSKGRKAAEDATGVACSKNGKPAQHTTPVVSSGAARKSQVSEITRVNANGRFSPPPPGDAGSASGIPDFSKLEEAINAVCEPILGKKIDRRMLLEVQGLMKEAGVSVADFVYHLYLPGTIKSLRSPKGTYGLLPYLVENAKDSPCPQPQPVVVGPREYTRDELVQQLVVTLELIEGVPNSANMDLMLAEIANAPADLLAEAKRLVRS